jgi:molybdenum cofactor guanylyltransferase
MGQDKALLPFRGASLAEWVARAAAEAAGGVTLVGPPERYSGLGFRVIPDLFPGEGPLGGILTALRDTGQEWNLVVACDMPGLGAAILARLIGTARQSDADALVPVTPDRRPQPLCAVYRRSCAAPFEQAFAGGSRAVTAALATVRCLRLPIAETGEFQNVNTPEDWAAYAE